MTDFDRWFPEGVSYSYGGGVQSTAMLVLAAQGYLPRGPFLFSNVGDDSEHPRTMVYVREVAFDFAAKHGIELHELQRIPKKGMSKGVPETLYGRLMRPGSLSLPIPVRMPDTGAPGTRSCTADFKIRVVADWIRNHGATEAQPVQVGIGISTDEYQRAKERRADSPWEVPWYPLLHLEHRLAPGRTGLDRAACAQVIADAGLPVPPKSSCYFCPFHRPTHWNDMARDEPELFEKAAALEEHLNGNRVNMTCPGSGDWPYEATVGRTRDALVDENDETIEATVATYRSDYLPDGGQGACPRCRARKVVELIDGEWRVVPHERGPVYFTRFGKPLRSIFEGQQQLSMLPPNWDEDEGYRCGDVCDT